MKTLIISVVTLFFTSYTYSAGADLQVGDKAPEFKAVADNGSTWNLKDYLGRKDIVVYFYPAAMSSGCTKEACAYRDEKENLKMAGVEVVGVSGDKVENLRLFKEAENLNFTLLSDDKGTIAKAFGVPVSAGGVMKSNIGGIEHDLVRGVTAKRWTFIIGKNGKIIYKDESVNPEKDAAEVLDFLKQHPSE